MKTAGIGTNGTQMHYLLKLTQFIYMRHAQRTQRYILPVGVEHTTIGPGIAHSAPSRI